MNFIQINLDETKNNKSYTMLSCCLHDHLQFEHTIIKIPYKFGDKYEKNLIFITCKPNGFDFNILIPYHSALNYSIPLKHHYFFNVIKTVNIDLKGIITAGNSKFQYKVYDKIDDYIALIPLNFPKDQKIIVIVETLYH